MSNSGPSASAVANEVRRKQLTARMKIESPEVFTEYSSRFISEQLWFSVGFFIACGVGYFVFVASIESSLDLAMILSFTVWTGVFCLFGYLVRSRIRSHDLINDFEYQLVKKEINQHSGVMKMADKLDEEGALQKGHRIVAGANATIVIDSSVINSFNHVNDSDPALGQAVATLAGYIDQQGSKEAADILAELVAEIEGARKPTRLKAFWSALVGILPDVAKLTTAAAAIRKLFS